MEEQPVNPQPKPEVKPTTATPAPPAATKAKTNTSAPAPVASTSNLASARPSSPDIDIESPDSEGQAMDDGPTMERDPLSEEIAKQLERGLPRWPGFGDKGWMEFATTERMFNIVHAIKNHKDVMCVPCFCVVARI